MASRSREFCKKSYPDFEWSISNVKSVLQNVGSIIKSPLHEFCDANWELRVTRNGTSICFYLCKVVQKQPEFPSFVTNHNSHKIFISLKGFIVKENGNESLVFDRFLTAKAMKHAVTVYSGITRYENFLYRQMLWIELEQTNHLKVICKFRCIDCPVKLAYIPIPSNQALNPLKRKHPEEEELVEFTGSKEKMLRPPGVDALLNNIKDLLASGEDSDVTIKVKDREFRAHKNILRAWSSVIFKMFSHDLSEKKNGIIDITDCEPDAFQEFLNYLYAGELDSVSKDIMCNLYYIGDKYGVEEVKKICVNSMLEHLSVETFCEIVTFAQLYKESTILEAASEFFINNVKAIISTDKWLSFLREHPVTANELHIKAADHYTNTQIKK